MTRRVVQRVSPLLNRFAIGRSEDHLQAAQDRLDLLLFAGRQLRPGNLGELGRAQCFLGRGDDRLDTAWGLTTESRLGCQAVISGDVVCELPMYTRNYVQEGGGIQLGKSDRPKAEEVTR